MTEIIEDSEHKVRIRTDAKSIKVYTRNGEIALYMGDGFKSITSFVEDVKITTWYNSNPKKISKFKKANGQRMVIVGE